MKNTRKGLADPIIIGALVILAIVVVILGALVYNLNSNIGVIDQKGRELRAWAAKSAEWSTHVHEDHEKHHVADGIAEDHIAPPPDPPPAWQ
jgi:hypothetical protein